MKRNRKSQSAAIHLVPAIKALMLCMFFGGAAVGYVWQQRKLHELDAVQRTLEARLDLLRRDNRVLGSQLRDLQNSARLQDRAKQFRINLYPPAISQVVRLPEPSAALHDPLNAEPPNGDPLLADRPGSAPSRFNAD